MGVKTTQQGMNFLEIWSIQTNAFKTSKFQYNKTVDTSVEGHPLKGNLKISINSKISTKAWEDHLKEFLNNKEVSTNKTTYEDGQIDTIVSGMELTDRFGYIYAVGTAQDTFTKFYAGCGIYSGATGNLKTSYGAPGEAPIEIQTVDYAASLTIPSTCFPTTITPSGESSARKFADAAPAADIVLASGEYGTIVFLTVT